MPNMPLTKCVAVPSCRVVKSVSPILVVWLSLLLLCVMATADPEAPHHAYVPPELQVADPEIKALLESAENSAKLGNYGEVLAPLEKALELATKLNAVADRAIVEDHLAVYYFTQGKLEDAKSQWLKSLSDGTASSNLVLQADVLVALSALHQSSGHVDRAIKAVNEALELSRKSKNLYIQSRVLGELSRLQLLSGKTDDARSSIEEALQIDRVNKYAWEAGHLLGMAWVCAAESKPDKTMELAISARELAITKENYLTFIQASLFLGQMYVRTGSKEKGLQLLELSRKGLSEEGKPLFPSPDAYNKTTSLPYFKVTFSEALGIAYESVNRLDDAIRSWRELYEVASDAGFTLARAESARHLADLYRAKKEFTKSIDNYALAADAAATGGNEQSRIEALTNEAVLLFQEGDKDRALRIDEELLPLAKNLDNVTLQFLVDLSIAEILNGSTRTDRIEIALNDAESLVDSEVKVPGVGPQALVELYFRLADLYEKRKDSKHELIALEKGLTPAIALAGAPKEKQDVGPRDLIMQGLELKIPSYHVRDSAENAYNDRNLAEALVWSEILQYFEEFDSTWKGKYEEYKQNINNDPTLTRELQIAGELFSQDDGPAFLARNIENMRTVANRVRPLGLGLLAHYYMSHQRPDLLVKYARQALSLGVNENDPWTVAMTCELAYGLLMEKDVKSAVDVVTRCMAAANKLGNPQLLVAANQTNVWVLDAAGKHGEARDSIDFLLTRKPRDPLMYVQLAQMKTQQGDWPAAADAWKKALDLYEALKDMDGAASAHLALATLPNVAPDAEDKRIHLEAADKIYRQLGSTEGRVKVEATLGVCEAARKDESQSRRYFENALSISRQAKRGDLEAFVLSQTGQAYQSSGDLSRAIGYFRQSADLYRNQKDSVNEALQLMNAAYALDGSDEPDQALSTVMRAQIVADKSNSWAPRYWVRRAMATIYTNQGRFQDAVNALREAKQISDDVNQPLASAWVALGLAANLETIGNWEEASQQINSALPVLQQFEDTDDEATAYVELMAIYGARESELKDLSKALEYYQLAYQLVVKTHPGRAAELDLDLTEIYWEQGQFKDAIAKASEALGYYQKTKNEVDEAGALISLAEAQRSGGDLKVAADSLQQAEPLVKRAKNFYTLGRFYYGQAGLYRAQQRLNEAIAQYEKVIAMLEQFKSGSSAENRSKVAEHYDFVYDELIETYYALGQSDKQHEESAADRAFEYAELNKARAFANSWGHAFVDGLRHQVPAPMQEKESDIANKRATLESELQEAMLGTGNHSVKQVEESLAKLQSDESDLANELRRANPAYAEVRYPQPITIGQIPLHPGDVLVQFKVLNQATLVWLLVGSERGTSLSAFYKIDRPKQWFSDRVFRIRDAFNGGHPEQFDPAITDELLNALFPASALQSLQVAKLVIFIPDDIFFLLPFEILTSHGQYVLLGKPTEYFPSSAALRLARTSIHAAGDWQESFIGIADPVTSSNDLRYQAISLFAESDKQGGTSQSSPTSFDRIVSRGFSLERLPATADEVQGVASLFASSPMKAEIRTGVDATKQKLLRTDLARYRFIHFATHGILPVESGIKEPALVLSYDGKGQDEMLLTMSEILGLRLRADMVVLSACNTGSGKVTRAEGVASLGTAFLAAGASSTTVSLWHVADASTAELMKELYKNLVSGMPRAAALAAARSTLFAKGYPYQNPFFWSPFILMGE